MTREYRLEILQASDRGSAVVARARSTAREASSSPGASHRGPIGAQRDDEPRRGRRGGAVKVSDSLRESP